MEPSCDSSRKAPLSRNAGEGPGVRVLADRLPGLVLAVSLAAALVGACWRLRRWRAGRPTQVDPLRGLAAVPSRYLVDLHAVVLRDPLGPNEKRADGAASARMHVLTAAGLVLATAALLVDLIAPRSTTLVALLLVALSMMAAGITLLLLRRWPRPRPARLSGAGFDRLPFALCAFVAFFARAALADLGLVSAIEWTTWSGLAWTTLGTWACVELFTGTSWARCGTRWPVCCTWRFTHARRALRASAWTRRSSRSRSTRRAWACRRWPISAGTSCSVSTRACSAVAAKPLARLLRPDCRSVRRS